MRNLEECPGISGGKAGILGHRGRTTEIDRLKLCIIICSKLHITYFVSLHFCVKKKNEKKKNKTYCLSQWKGVLTAKLVSLVLNCF